MILSIALAAGVFFADALTKWLAALKLAGRGSVTLIEGVLVLRLTRNDGMALGVMSGNAVAIVLLPLAVIALGWLLMRRYVMTPFKRVAVALIFGGFLGNFFERLLAGYVLDMIYFPFLPWFVCNVADISICAGVALMAASLLLRPQDWREKHAKPDADGRE